MSACIQRVQLEIPHLPDVAPVAVAPKPARPRFVRPVEAREFRGFRLLVTVGAHHAEYVATCLRTRVGAAWRSGDEIARAYGVARSNAFRLLRDLAASKQERLFAKFTR